MSVVPKFRARFIKGRVHLEHPQFYEQFLVGNFKEGDRVDIVIKKWRRPRTTGQIDEKGNQNGWYWCVVLPICAKEIGETIDDMHEIFIQEFAPYTMKQFGKKKIPIKVRTSEMNTVQFTEYVETIRQKMAEMGAIIPDPQNVDYQ